MADKALKRNLNMAYFDDKLIIFELIAMSNTKVHATDVKRSVK